MKRLVLGLAVGAAIGYVLGAKAGRERYVQIADMASKTWQSTGMDTHSRQITDQAAATAREAGAYVADATSAKLAQVTDLVQDKVQDVHGKVQDAHATMQDEHDRAAAGRSDGSS